MTSFETGGDIEANRPSGFDPLTIIIRGVYLDSEGIRRQLTHLDLRDHIQKQMDRFTPTNTNKASRVASALEKLWQQAGYIPTEAGILRHQVGSRGVAYMPPGLTEREQRVLDMRPLAGTKERTLAELGQEFGVTPNRIRQIEGRAASKARYFSQHPERAVYDALTFLSDPSHELALRIGPQTAANVSMFLLAELNPELVINPGAQTQQQQLEWPTTGNEELH